MVLASIGSKMGYEETKQHVIDELLRSAAAHEAQDIWKIDGIPTTSDSENTSITGTERKRQACGDD
jgi:hypothetical protein